MHVELGTDVFTADGDKVGSVEKIVLNPETKQIDMLVVSSGIFDQHERLVELPMVQAVGDDGVQLNLTKSQFEEVQAYAEERFVTVPEEDYNDVPFIIPNAMGAGGYLYGSPYVGRGYEGGRDSFFDAAPAVSPIIEDESNIPQSDILVAEGTNVIGSDGESVGKVHEVYFDPDGRMQGFLVKAGLIFKHDVRVPIDWVERANGDEIALNVTSHEAESRSYDVKDSTL